MIIKGICGCKFDNGRMKGLQIIQSFSDIFENLEIMHPAIVDVFDIFEHLVPIVKRFKIFFVARRAANFLLLLS